MGSQPEPSEVSMSSHRRSRSLSTTPGTGRSPQKDGPYDELCRRWILFALIDLGAHRNVLHETHCEVPEMLSYLGLDGEPTQCASRGAALVGGEEGGEASDFNATAVLAAAKLKRIQEGSRPVRWPEDAPILKNLRLLQQHLGLSEVDFRILVLCVLAKHVLVLGQTIEILGTMSDLKLYSALATVLEISAEQVQAALAGDGRLSLSGVARLQSGDMWHPVDKVELLDGLADHLNSPCEDLLKLFAGNFVSAPAPKHGPEEFGHFEPYATWVGNHIRSCLQSRDRGVNVLLYGSPGVGKTEFVRTMCRSVGADLFEVSVVQADGQRISGRNRLQAYVLAQRILEERRNAVLFFDEAEDIDGMISEDDDDFLRRRVTRNKGWLNRVLEVNAVPAVFVSNKVRHVDPAHLRRFRLTVEMRVPQLVRDRLLKARLVPLGVSEAWCTRHATSEHLVPALVENLARVMVTALDQGGPSGKPDEIATGLVDQILHAQGARSHLPEAKSASAFYDLSLSHTSPGVEALVEGLMKQPRARLLFFGPPGTGKSALADHIAHRLGRGALHKRASDLQKMYVGETERAIAAAFREARMERSVLVVDEADSFLASRSMAHRNWEVSQVNEMLQQLEDFDDGIFIATTNLVDRIDEASFRRFDEKVEFGYMTETQAKQAMSCLCQDLGVYESGCEQLVAKLTRLTPGDFATVRRQVRFRPVGTAAEVARRLYDEVRHKPGASRPMGFVSPDPASGR